MGIRGEREKVQIKEEISLFGEESFRLFLES